MDIKGFNPRGKTFHFCLDEYSCYRCKTGSCSLDNISLEDLKNISPSDHAHRENSVEYCRGMAKLFLDHKFTSPATIFLNMKCGHYDFDDGQHRTCVAARILQKGGQILLNVDLAEQDCVCRDCLMKAHFREQENTLTPIDKLFSTKKCRNFVQSEKEYHRCEFMYSFEE